MSVQAMAWVLDDAPGLPAHLVGTLMAVANHADTDGRNAWPSQETIAAQSRKSSRAVRKDLAQLEELGLIRRGDQRVVSHIREDRRPVVWDLALAGGTERPDADDRPPGSGRNSRVERPELQGRTTGTVVPTTRPEPSKEPKDHHVGASPRLDVERLCKHLADRIEANGAKRPTITVKWRDAARLMLDRDGRTEDQVHRAIGWCQDSEFWRSNILSMPKLRDKYDQLRLQASRSTARQSTTDQRVRQAVDAGERVAAMMEGAR